MKYNYCGIVFIGGGSSWAHADDKQIAAQKAAEQAKRDWGKVYKFPLWQEFKVCMYDMSDVESWHADHTGVYNTQTLEEVPMIEIIAATA